MADSLLNQQIGDDHKVIMQYVLQLATYGLTTAAPNPRVGSVVINDGVVVGEGWHEAAGGPHAERVALRQAGEQARGSTLYISLEPCCHQGRTPPCTDAIINAGVTKVVAAMSDPNPLVEGGGFELLRGAGIEVETSVLNEESAWLNRGFISRMRRQRPWLVLKSAATLDGKTAAYDGESKWITGDSARQEVQQLRAECSAILTGIGTVLADDPSMNVRLEGASRQPFRVMLDSKLQLPNESKIIGEDNSLLVFTLSDDIDRIAELTEQGVEVIQQQGDKLDLSLVLEDLAKWQCNEVLVEAGQTLSGAFLQANLVDELVLFYAGSILGDQGKNMFHFDHPLPFEDRSQYKITDVEKVDDDIKVHAVKESSVSQLHEKQS